MRKHVSPRHRRWGPTLAVYASGVVGLSISFLWVLHDGVLEALLGASIVCLGPAFAVYSAQNWDDAKQGEDPSS